MSNTHTTVQLVPRNLAVQRRSILKATGVALAVGVAVSAMSPKAEAETTSDGWDTVFPKSKKVTHQKVRFKNRYGITLAGDLYTPLDLKGKAAALAVCGPFGAVKEQSSGLYAQTMAERGFITLAFDGSYTGESGGEPRNIASAIGIASIWVCACDLGQTPG